MNTLETLKNALAILQTFSKSEISEEDFQKHIAELKAILFQLKDSLTTTEQQNQVEDILSYQVLSQRTPLERFFIRYFGSMDQHRSPIAPWKIKGKYLYDLDAIELKLAGLIYKLEQ